MTLHSLAMALVVGINIAVALRLVGVAPNIAMAPLLRFYTLHWWGVLLIFLSGLALLLAYPAKALTNPVFYLKFTALIAGLIIAAWFQRLFRGRSTDIYSLVRIKQIAWLSLLLWVITITAGRFLAYTHSVLLASRFY